VVTPPVLFLDEPTTGLDPQARVGLWEVIRRRVDGRETTSGVVKVDVQPAQSAKPIANAAHGRVVAEGTADELKASVGGTRIELTLVDEADAERAREVIVVATHSAVAVTGRTLTAQAEDPSAALISVLTALNEAGIELHDAGIRRPTLDDVFLTLTGHAIEEQEVAA